MVLGLIILNSSLFISTSCSDMLNTNSDLLEFAEDNTLSQAKDSIFSVMGIVHSMQVIADRTVLLGELRSDLLATTPRADKDIKEIASFNVSEKNAYNNVSDYYAVINNCNYFIANVDTTLTKLGKKIFEKEYAVVKTYRAWAYLQLAKTYGNVPLMLDPALTEAEAQAAMNMKPSDIKTICEYFIEELKPFVDTEQPNYGSIGRFNSRKFFIPVRVLLGELCLWAGHYQESAQYFYEYLAMKNNPVYTGANAITWNVVNNDFANGSIRDGFFQVSSYSSQEHICYIPMEETEFSGVKSYVSNVYKSTHNNDYFAQVLPSKGMRNISSSQNYCLMTEISAVERDTTYAPHEGLRDDLMIGDLRLFSVYSYSTVNRDESSRYSKEINTIYKLDDNAISLYRRQYVYLMFAEALCRAGYPESAFCILKYGLRDRNVELHISKQERKNAGSLLYFDDEVFTDENTKGIHSRGCGNVDCDTLYSLPQPKTALASYKDTVNYRIPLVEEMIVNEMALEMAFEGRRYYDLMRVALRRNDPSFFATPIAKRTGELDEQLFNYLMDTKNWYLPLR